MISFPLLPMRRTGFTLMEMALALGIVAVTAGLSVPIYRDYQIRSDLNLATEQVTQGIERARLLAQQGAEDDGWGFYVPAGVLFKGARYDLRDPAYDEVYPMPSLVKVHNLYEVAYNKVSGTPSEMGEITLTTLSDEKRTITIEVFQQSIVVTTPDTVVICVEGIPTAVQEHQVPTDAIFPTDVGCLGATEPEEDEEEADEGSAGSADTASASSAPSSEQTASSQEQDSSVPASSADAASSVLMIGGSSSAPSDTPPSVTCQEGKMLICHVPPGNPTNRHTICIAPNAWPAHRAHGSTQGACVTEVDTPVPTPMCADRFRLDDNGKITLLGKMTVTVRVLGSEITFGPNGPEVDVSVLYRSHSNAFKKLFAGKDVDGGEVEVTKVLPAGATFEVQARGTYYERNWLRFDETFTTSDGTGHFSAFRDGAPLPNYPAFAGQQSVASMLEAFLDPATGLVRIGPHALLLLGELGADLSGETADFQDIVVLLEFGTPVCP